MPERDKNNKIMKRLTELTPEELEEVIREAVIASNKDQLEMMNSK